MDQPPRIHITGAAGAGVSTLGQELATRLGLPLADVDAFFWLPTDPPFTTRRPPGDRLRLIRDQTGSGGWVISGAMDSWGEALAAAASLVVLLDTPTPVRLLRLRARERARYGSRILPGGDMHQIYTDFLNWAASYDDPHFRGRSRAGQQAWLTSLSQPVLRLDGRQPATLLADQVLVALAQQKGG